jgi:hypothetical protein
MANTSAVPILLNDGRKRNGLRVQELKVALVSAGVPEFENSHSKADKMSPLKDVLSRSRASQGPFGALEDGRLIGSLSVEDLKSSIPARGGNSNLQPWGNANLQNNLPSELQKKMFGWPPAVLRFCFQVEKTK